jgi:hypothetical protein
LSNLSDEDRRFLQEAAEYLENPGFLIQVTNLVGKPAEFVINALPGSMQRIVAGTTQKALHSAMEWAVWSLPDRSAVESPADDENAAKVASLQRRDARHHTAVTAVTGAVGGFFGLPGAAVEIPLTTTVMLRSIARIAADSGARLDDPATRLQCLAVFSLGSQPLEEMESAYLTTRIGLAMALNKASQFLATGSARELGEALSKGTAPILVRLINEIATRFQIVVSEKLAAQALPVMGAAMGALLNTAFTEHFNSVARYHFGILRLERQHGQQPVQDAYRAVCQQVAQTRGLQFRAPAQKRIE